MTIKKRALIVVCQSPGKTATWIAHEMGAKPSTVSSALAKAAKAGEVRRRKANWTKGPWLYMTYTPQIQNKIEPWEIALTILIALIFCGIGHLSIYLALK